MNIMGFVQLIMTFISYYFFSDAFFEFCAAIKGKRVSKKAKILNFLLVYVWFFVASILQLQLVVNWFVFMIILGIQLHKTFDFSYSESYAISLFCITTGLAVNIFCRSLVAIIMDAPLSQFDNQLSSLRGYPIIIGFFCMAILLYFLRKRQFTERVGMIIQYPKSLYFYLRTEICIFLFLNAQLLMYSQSTNHTGIKMWGIKGAVFSGLVLVITIIYTLRVATLYYYMQKQYLIREKLIKEKADTNQLWMLAYTDMLTNCHNHHLLEQRMQENEGYNGNITIGFVDVNGLKTINDKYGHMIGDGYLVTVAQTLRDVFGSKQADVFRYGGDEFIIQMDELRTEEMIACLEEANQKIQHASETYDYSISYGIAEGPRTDYKRLVKEADEKMYQHKHQFYKYGIPAPVADFTEDM